VLICKTGDRRELQVVGRRPDDPAADHDVARRESAAGESCGAIVYRSAAIRNVLAQVRQVAPTNATVLLVGKTGVGKERFAEAIHEASPRRHLPIVRVNCAAIPATLFESELFGHERGAFTGAVSRQIGRFEAANHSTLFLDEVGEIPIEMQAKLLRAVEARTVERLGGTGSKRVDIRIIAATNQDLAQAVRNRTFREDLYYRLNVFPIRVPPLRERACDVPALAWKFIDELSGRLGKTIDAISSRSLFEMQRYPWPGNVRELRNAIEREMILATSSTLAPAVPERVWRAPAPSCGPRAISTAAIGG
jgi:transcriptional regulator with GAF, ATPase, and Fis domain